jgi:hypothetical protein
MMNEARRVLLGYYEAIGQVSQVMLHAARRGDWKALEHAHACCEELIRCIQATGLTPDALDEPGRKRRMEILRQVIADDARIREYSRPASTPIERLLRRCEIVPLHGRP